VTFRTRLLVLVAAWLLALLPLGHADGPHIAFHGTQGCCAITVFSAPDPLVAGDADLNILVQGSKDGTMLNAPVTGHLLLSGQPPISFAVGTPANSGPVVSGNVPGVTVHIPAPGQYQLQLEVAAPDGPLHFTGTLLVAPDHGQRNAVLWAVFLPIGLVLLFLANQQAKLRLYRPRASAPARSSLSTSAERSQPFQ
jgi:hypothetical protein